MAVLARGRNEVYGILLAEAEPHWRARLLTYPSMLWCIPGARETMKFVADSPGKAEELALEFIREHCRDRGIRILDDNLADELESGPIDREYAPQRHVESALAERHVRLYEIRFGATKADTRARTRDLSRGGLFVVTDQPLSPGRALKMLLELDDYTIPLVGTVAWVRTRAESGRPAGMGIELRDPPPMYVRHVRSVAAGAKDRGGTSD